MKSIVQFSAATRPLLPHPQEPFAIIGRLIPHYDGENWAISEQIFGTPSEKTYPGDTYDPDAYLENPDQAAFLAICSGRCVGSIRTRRSWNEMAFVEDLAVDRAYRGQGLGTSLMDAAAAWAKESGLFGIYLETQDLNLLACRFYLKYGFRLGGIDRMLYAAGPSAEETALFFYLPLRGQQTLSLF